MTDGKPQSQRDWRWIALYIVAVGGMSVSISGQVQSIEHQLGGFLAVVFAATNDVGAILALDIALGAAGGAIKRWAWVAILLAAGTGAALNAHHAMSPVPDVPPVPAAPLPTGFAILVGAEPVVLVLVLSHLIGLVVAARRGQVEAEAGDRQGPHRQAGDDHNATRQAVAARVGDRQDTTIIARQPTSGDRQAALPAGRQAGHRQVPDRQGGDHAGAVTQTPHAVTRQADRSPASAAVRPARALAVAPEPRLPWMTDALISAVVAARRADPQYGRGQIVEQHKIGSGKARSLLAYIDQHDLMRESA